MDIKINLINMEFKKKCYGKEKYVDISMEVRDITLNDSLEDQVLILID